MRADILGLPNPIKIVGGLLAGAGKTIAGSVFGELAKLIVQALNHVLASMATLWVRIPTPNLTTGGGSQPSSAVDYTQKHLLVITTAAAVMGVVAGCGRMVWEQRAHAGRDVLRGLVVYVLVSGGGLAVLALALDVADAFSTWVISDAVANQSFGNALTELLALQGGLGLLLIILFGFLALVGSVIQIAFMVIRGGMLVILAGVLPTAAAFTGTESGRQWFRKAVGWMIAFVLYKPAAAVIYATAIRLSTSGVFSQGGVVGVITGLALMGIAVLALPALLRFTVPLVAAVASGGAGAMLGAAAGAASVAMPSGAIAMGGARAASAAGAAAAGGASAPPPPSGGDPSGSRPSPGGGGDGNGGEGVTGGDGSGAVTLADSGTQLRRVGASESPSGPTPASSASEPAAPGAGPATGSSATPPGGRAGTLGGGAAAIPTHQGAEADGARGGSTTPAPPSVPVSTAGSPPATAVSPGGPNGAGSAPSAGVAAAAALRTAATAAPAVEATARGAVAGPGTDQDEPSGSKGGS